MIRDEHAAWAVLSSVSGLGPLGFGRLIAAHGSATAVLRAALEGEPLGPGRTQRVAAGQAHPMADGLRDAVRQAAAEADRLADQVDALGLAILPLIDPRYPDRLRAIDLPPPVVYVQGDPAALGTGPVVAVVGTRRPTDRGRRTAAEIAAALAASGATVVSGLAIGVDGVAHAAALDRRGRTVGVLGSGHAHLYPRVHRRLGSDIVDGGGAILSEFAPDTHPSRGTFPRRNRLISGLSDATIVVEAGEASGALITAGWALEQGRECYVVPGALGEAASKGCLRLLRDCPGQVRVVAGIPELMEDLGLAAAPGVPSPGAVTSGDHSPLGQLEHAIAVSLAAGARTADELVALTGMPVAAVLGAVTLLEGRGLAVGVFGRYQATPRLLASNLAA